MTEETHICNKKSYEAPRLIVYGDIRVITQAVNMAAGALDGATNAMGGLLKTN